MNNRNKWFLSLVLLFVFVGLIVFSNVSNSIKEEDNRDFSLEIAKDEHVVPYESVYVLIDGEKEHMTNISLLVGNDKYSFKTDLLDIQSVAHFELPNYNDNVVAGMSYYIKEATIKYDDGRIVRYTTSKNDNLYISIDERESYFVVDEINDDVDAWRDFRGVDFKDYIYSNGNIYFKLNGDTRNMVDIELEFVKIDEMKSFKADVEGFGNRLYFDISNIDVEVGEEYYLKDMTIYYTNGGSYNYNADNYANILNNRIFITNVEDKVLKAEAPSTDGNKPNATNNEKRENNVAGGLIVLFLIIVAAFGIFFYIKDED